MKRVDHLLVRSSFPEPLFALFKNQLLLPEAWPIATNPFFTSGGIHLGNLNLEIIHLSHDRSDSQPPARLYGIAFELHPYGVSLPELSRRQIPHTPPLPFYQFDEQGWQITTWTNVYLGGLLGSNLLAKSFFSLSHKAPSTQWERGSLPTLFNRRVGMPFIFDRVYPNGVTFSVEYNPAWLGINVRPDPDRSGVDIKQVSEILIGARDPSTARDRWNNLLNPYPEIAEGVWQIPDDLLLRIIPGRQNGLIGMVWQAHSLNRSVHFLHRRGLLGKEKDGMATIDPEKIFGLEIRLIQ